SQITGNGGAVPGNSGMRQGRKSVRLVLFGRAQGDGGVLAVFRPLNRLQVGADLDAHDVAAFGLDQGVVDHLGDVLGGGHLALLLGLALLAIGVFGALHVGADAAGFDERDLDAVVVDLFAEGFAPALDGGLGGD